mgnify:CR=1 FL=1
MEKLKIKQELIDLIMELSDDDYNYFCSNYSIEDKGRKLLEFIEDLQDEEEVAKVIYFFYAICQNISEIHFNTETDY